MVLFTIKEFKEKNNLKSIFNKVHDIKLDVRYETEMI